MIQLQDGSLLLWKVSWLHSTYCRVEMVYHNSRKTKRQSKRERLQNRTSKPTNKILYWRRDDQDHSFAFPMRKEKGPDGRVPKGVIGEKHATCPTSSILLTHVHHFSFLFLRRGRAWKEQFDVETGSTMLTVSSAWSRQGYGKEIVEKNADEYK